MIEFNATFIIAILSFTVFIMIMNAIFYNPILGMIRKRDNYISSNYEDSKRFAASAQEYKITHAAKIEQVQDRCRHQFRIEVEEARNQSAKKINVAKENHKMLIQEKKYQLAQDAEELKNTVKATVLRDLASAVAMKFHKAAPQVDYESVKRVMN